MKQNVVRIMKNSLAVAALSVSGGVAHAQSSVSLYGIVDDSLRYVSNVGGHSLLAVTMTHGGRWGFLGSEDLGGGLKTVFQLENGFDINSGVLGQGGRMFGRQAWVGLSSGKWGTVKFGRQYDPTVDLVSPLTADGTWGATFTTPGDVDNNDASSRANNSLKYVSPLLAGLQFEALYALGGVAGATGAGQTLSAAASYSTGALSLAAGYLRMDNPLPTAAAFRSTWAGSSDGTFDGGPANIGYKTARSIQIASAAAQYVIGNVTFGLRYSNAQYLPDAQSTFTSKQKYNTGAGHVTWWLTPAAALGLGYVYTHASGDASATYNQVSLGGDYLLSKRTDVYLKGAWQHVSGEQRNGAGRLMPAVASVSDFGGYTSNSPNQTLVSVGIRHRF